MLLQLNIENFALIEKLSICFNRGFNILTGETGAGKSILIDAINFVLGGKFSKDLIRTGEDRTYVEAIFSIENHKTKEVLESLEIQYEDLVIISRETFQSGKTVAKVNGKALILSQVKLLSQTLMDIHGQHENVNLLDASNHITYLDSFGGKPMFEELKDYSAQYDKLETINKKIVDLRGKDGDREKIIDFLKYQIDEITKANLKVNEDVDLEKQYLVSSNSEKISNVLNTAYNILYSSSNEETPVYDKINEVLHNLRSIENNIDRVKKIADSIEEISYTLKESVDDIRNLKDTIYYDEKELEYINERLYQINSYKKKYGNTIEEILNYKEKIANQYNEYNNSEEIIIKLKEQRDVLIKSLTKMAQEIHNKREKLAKDLEVQVKSELSYIGLEKSVFKIDVSKQEELSKNGFDKVQFLISTNPGEPLKPLEKVVSGGELSRIMLALKTVFVDKDEIPSVIFDEIDTGISGRVAQSVGEKMYSISKKHQVFCITHLPQIACMSDVHFVISKVVHNDKTFTIVQKISSEEKIEEIARMIGGSQVTKLTIENSKELVKIAELKKENLIS